MIRSIVLLSFVTILLVRSEAYSNKLFVRLTPTICLNMFMSDLDYIDAYQMSIGGAPIFGSYSALVKVLGLPNKLIISQSEVPIRSKKQVQDVLKKSGNNGNPPVLIYPGITFWYLDDQTVIPTAIDFRKLNFQVKYGNKFFGKNFTVQDFTSLFPNSASMQLPLPESFFEITTQEHIPLLKHFHLNRRSRSNPDASPMIEFTFQDNGLIYISFVNF